MPTIWATTTLLNLDRRDPVGANSVADQIARNQDACNEWQVCFSPEGQVFIRMEVSSIKRVKLPPGWEMTEKKPLWKERQDAITSMPNYRVEQLTHKQLDEEAATQMGWNLVESDSWNNQEAYFCDFNHKKIMTVSQWNPSIDKGQAHDMLNLALLNFWLCDMHLTCNSFDITLCRVLGPKDTPKRVSFSYDTKDTALAITRASVSALWACKRTGLL